MSKNPGPAPSLGCHEGGCSLSKCEQGDGLKYVKETSIVHNPDGKVALIEGVPVVHGVAAK